MSIFVFLKLIGSLVLLMYGMKTVVKLCKNRQVGICAIFWVL